MEYFCDVWVGASNCYIDFLDKLQKHPASLEPLGPCRNVFTQSRDNYSFGKFGSELAESVVLHYYRGMPNRCSDRLHDFSLHF